MPRSSPPVDRQPSDGSPIDESAPARVATALFQIAQRLGEIADPDAVPRRLAETIRAATGASLSVVARWNPAEGRMVIVATDGATESDVAQLAGVRLEPNAFRTVRAALAGRAAVRAAPFDPADVPADVLDRLGFGAVGGAPVIVGGEPWGLVVVATRPGDPDLVDGGRELLAGVASIASSAIARAEALAALERQAEALESAVEERTLQLRRAIDDLERASRAKTEFLASVSHELRTPLTAIIGFGELLVAEADGPLTSGQREAADTIGRSARHLLGLIDDLIDVSEIEAGRLELTRQPVLLAPVIHGVVEELRPRAGEKGLVLAVDGTDLPDEIQTDPARLRQILRNLVDNAVKFTPAGGSIRIVGARTGNASIVVEVIDTGIGVPDEQQAAIFERFHRLAGPEHAGTGLGLAVSRELARLLGGDVSLQSALGLGSTFRLVLPIGLEDGA